jgi:DNA (cytosine-5)-methyltransferase 1
MIKILNLYAGIGGNRKKWGGNIMVTAVELNPTIAAIYKDFFPQDEVIVGDAHQYLLEHFQEYDFIWASPPCPTHSKIRKNIAVARGQNEPVYPDMKLYEEVLLLQGYFKGKYVIENVISWYNPLIKPFEYREHYYWANFVISGDKNANRCHNGTKEELSKLKGFDLSKYEGIDKIKTLRNCVEPEAGLYIFNCAFKEQQKEISNFFGERK